MKKRKYRKKSPKSKLKKALDKLWSEIVRSGGECEFCGSIAYLNAHHHYGRRAESTRWDIDNGICLCPKCHVYSSVFSAHQTPADFVKWIEKKRGKPWATRLRKKHSKIKSYTIEELEKTFEELERKLIKLERKK